MKNDSNGYFRYNGKTRLIVIANPNILKEGEYETFKEAWREMEKYMPDEFELTFGEDRCNWGWWEKRVFHPYCSAPFAEYSKKLRFGKDGVIISARLTMVETSQPYVANTGWQD